MQLKIIEKYLLSLVLAIFLTGCTNALYFYETEKISLSVEARPDSSQPVQGNLGIKQRVVLIAPKKDKNNDAVSAISSFNFKIIPEPGTPFNPVLIQTAFIAGEAASQLNTKQAGDAAEAITLNVPENKKVDELAKDIIKAINDDNDRNILKRITAHDFGDLSDDDYAEIRRILHYERQTYYARLHKALREQLN